MYNKVSDIHTDIFCFVLLVLNYLLLRILWYIYPYPSAMRPVSLKDIGIIQRFLWHGLNERTATSGDHQWRSNSRALSKFRSQRCFTIMDSHWKCLKAWPNAGKPYVRSGKRGKCPPLVMKGAKPRNKQRNRQDARSRTFSIVGLFLVVVLNCCANPSHKSPISRNQGGE